MKRNGNKLKTLPDGHPRRMADGKNAWRKMNEEQRKQFVLWMLQDEDAGGRGLMGFFPLDLRGDDIFTSRIVRYFDALDRRSK